MNRSEEHAQKEKEDRKIAEEKARLQGEASARKFEEEQKRKEAEERDLLEANNTTQKKTEEKESLVRHQDIVDEKGDQVLEKDNKVQESNASVQKRKQKGSVLYGKEAFKKKNIVIPLAKKRKRKNVDSNALSIDNFEDKVYSEKSLELLYKTQGYLHEGYVSIALENYVTLAQNGDYLGIIVSTLEKMVRDYPDRKLAWKALGYAYKKLNMNDKAVNAFKKAE
jgi:hypothetical protein